MHSKVESEPKDKVATIEREFKFRKRTAFFSVFGNLNVPLNLIIKVVYRHVFFLHPCLKLFPNMLWFTTRFPLGF